MHSSHSAAHHADSTCVTLAHTLLYSPTDSVVTASAVLLQVSPVRAGREVCALVWRGAQVRPPGHQGPAAAQPGEPRLQAQVGDGGGSWQLVACGGLRWFCDLHACPTASPHPTSLHPATLPCSAPPACSFNDIVKRLAATEEGTPTFVSRRTESVERFVVAHGQIFINQFQNYPGAWVWLCVYVGAAVGLGGRVPR